MQRSRGVTAHQWHNAGLCAADAAGHAGLPVQRAARPGLHFSADGLPAGEYVLVVQWWNNPGPYTGFLRLTPELAP